ncbi:hypothetical protein SmJEL517_g05965 [Synchytrium microbalum]|uniref:MIF4G domain-containing protein n=1 Tax=Synchytrium microbalum TaxID=1806994 RepID=A0A507BS14_9FUNG|nr:uncharacterized protein SmJEL517_g05965 [Synchytrium microbalum]TPX30482.1 hypothetical protein SmJEL517_g05965 [Synchytrium microbalum]
MSDAAIKENESGIHHKRELRAKNLDATKTRPDPSTFANLDGSIKKNTAFIKKLKTSLVADQLDALIKDITSLKLEKYISEIATAIAAEARFKTAADVLAAVEICSLLHQRFKDFTPELVPSLVKQIGPPPSTANLSPEQKEREESGRVAKQRSAMRLITELYLVGIVVDAPNAKESIMTRMIKDLISSDKEGYANLTLAVTFAKAFGPYFFGPKVHTDEEDVADKTAQTSQEYDIFVPKDIQNIIKSLFLDYFKRAEKDLVRGHKAIRKMEHANQEHLIARGEVSEERQERFEKNMKTYERLLTGVQALADALDQEMPDLPKDDVFSSQLGGSGATLTVAVRPDDEDAGTGVWEDEESKSFYEDLVDLRSKVPPVLLGERVEPKVETAEDIEQALAKEDDGSSSKTTTPEPTEIDAEDNDVATEEETATESATTTAAPSSGAPLALLITRLSEPMNREAIDTLAVEFCFINTKTARRKVATHLNSVSRQRLDLLPFYARFAATLLPYMPDIGQAVLDRNIRYMAELVKFKVAPPHMAFHYIKSLLDVFVGENVELLCIFLESCGRFLFRSHETSPRMATYLDIMMKKKAAVIVDPRQVALIDSAYYDCNPPTRLAAVKKERPPIQLYIRKVIYHDLNRKNVDKVLKQLRKLDWNDPLHLSCITKVFHKVWKVKFSNLHLVAFLASELMRHYPQFGIGVIDATLEDIRLGLETNLFKMNQRRIAVVKFLGELYNYNMLDSPVIFDTLFLLMTYGHEGGFVKPGVMNPLDAPHDFFRVRLICTLLETCGEYFDKGPTGRRLDDFLTYLQLYINSKAKAPIDIDFLVAETFELLRPSRRLYSSYEEALTAVQDLYSKRVGSAQTSQPEIAVSSPDDEMEEEEEGVGHANHDKDEDGESDDDDEGGEEDDKEEDFNEEDNNDEDVVVHMPETGMEDDPDNDEFDKDFSRMMQDSLESRKTAPRPPTFDVPIPAKSAAMKREEEGNMNPDQVAFTLLVKRGTKATSKSLVIPAESSLAQAARAQIEAEKEERGLLKQLVLNYEERGRIDAAREETFIENARSWGSLKDQQSSSGSTRLEDDNSIPQAEYIPGLGRGRGIREFRTSNNSNFVAAGGGGRGDQQRRGSNAQGGGYGQRGSSRGGGEGRGRGDGRGRGEFRGRGSAAS